MYEWFLQAWDKVAKDRSGEAVSPTCDNLSDKVQKNRRAWWMKGTYASTHPQNKEDYSPCCSMLDYVSPVARLDREKPHPSRNVALAGISARGAPPSLVMPGWSTRSSNKLFPGIPSLHPRGRVLRLHAASSGAVDRCENICGSGAAASVGWRVAVGFKKRRLVML